MTSEFQMIAKTFQGLEEVLAAELTELGANDIVVGNRMVSFTGDKEMLYRANFCLRTAVRVLKPISGFEATNADEVYEAVRAVEWADYMAVDQTFAVDAVVFSESFTHSKFVAYRVKDAIADYWRERTGKRPNVTLTNPDIRLNIHIAEQECTLSLDASGESLHLRGYRMGSVEAPLNEVLAAGLLKLAGWDGQQDLIDPMCGSGTILVEAALMARNIYPGVFRKGFGFEKWADFDADLLERIYNDDSAERPFEHTIYGYDINHKAVEVTTANAKAAGVAGCIKVEQRPLEAFEAPSTNALFITNPPYGERITTDDLLGLYRTLGTQLKQQMQGAEAWVLALHDECFAQIGLRPSVTLPMLNGALECEFRKYQLFKGGMREFRKEGGEIKTSEDRRRNDTKKPLRKRHDRPEGERRWEDRPRRDDRFEDEIPEALRHHHRYFMQQERRRKFAEQRSDDQKPYFKRDNDSSERPRKEWRKRDDDRQRPPFRKEGGFKPYDRREGDSSERPRKPWQKRDDDRQRPSFKRGGNQRDFKRDGQSKPYGRRDNGQKPYGKRNDRRPRRNDNDND